MNVIVVPALPVLAARDIESHATSGSASSFSRRGRQGKIGTTFSLMEGQVHRHRIVLENAGTVPIGQIRITLAMTVQVDTATTVVETEVFESDPEAPGERAIHTLANTAGEVKKALVGAGGGGVGSLGAGGGGVFLWDEDALAWLAERLPLLPGDTVALPLTVDARRGIPSAELRICFARDVEAAHSRSLTVPFELNTTPALRLLGIEVQLFGTSMPDKLMVIGQERTPGAGTALSPALTDTDTALVIITMENPTDHPFEVTCNLRHSLLHEDSSEIEGEAASSVFASTFEGHCVQNLAVPVQRKHFSKIAHALSVAVVRRGDEEERVPANGMYEDGCGDGGEETMSGGGGMLSGMRLRSQQQHQQQQQQQQRQWRRQRHQQSQISAQVHDECIAVLDDVLEIFWKSSHGIVGSISLAQDGQHEHITLSDAMIRRLAPPLVSIACCIGRDPGDGALVYLAGELPQNATPRKVATAGRWASYSGIASATPAASTTLIESLRSSSYPSPTGFFRRSFSDASGEVTAIAARNDDNGSGRVGDGLLSAHRPPALDLARIELAESMLRGCAARCAVGDVVPISVTVCNTGSREAELRVRIVPFEWSGGAVIELRAEGMGVVERGDGGGSGGNPGFLWTGSLGTTFHAVPPGQSRAHTVHLCPLRAGRFGFAVAADPVPAVATATGRATDAGSWWSSHPMQLDVVLST